MVKKQMLNGLIFLLLLCGHASAALLKDGTEIPVRLVENVNGNMNFTGETVYFQVVDDIIVDDQVLIAEGTFVKGMVHEAVGRKSMGKGGKLTLMPKSLKNHNDDLVKFEKYPLSQEGRKRTGATVAHVVMWGPLGLFAKGRAAYMFRGSEFDITVNGDYELSAAPAESAVQKDWNDFAVSFNEYKSKVNYRKGKIGKDFVVQVAESNDYDTNDLQIVQVDDQLLPSPLKPVSVTQAKNGQHVIAVFAFKDIIKYALPETSRFTFQIGDSYRSEAQLNTRWKLK